MIKTLGIYKWKKIRKRIDITFQKDGKVENMVYAIERVIEKEKLDAKVEIIREMIKEGDSIDKISRITKLSVTEIEKIAKDLSN